MIALTLLSAVISAASVAAVSENGGTTTSNVPFYLKRSDTDPNSVNAVVYYGEVGDTSKEINVPCTMKGSTSASTDQFVGPESMLCQCEAIKRSCSGWGSSSHSSSTKMINNSKCQLQVPFQFDFDENGTVVSVTFEKDNVDSSEAAAAAAGTTEDILVVPFYPKMDADGNIVAVEVTAANDVEQYSTMGMIMSLLLWFLIIFGGILLLVTIFRLIRRRMIRKASPSTNTVISPITPNVKNLSDLENSLPSDITRHRTNIRNDDDTVSETSSLGK